MKKHQRKLIAIGATIIMIAVIFINKDKISYFYNDVKVGKVDEAEAQKTIDKSFDRKTPKGEMPDYENMSEYRLFQEAHGMTHQKVKTEQKWGSSEITKDKIDRLYAIAQTKSFKDEEIRTILLKILERWSKGDFS